MEFLLITYGHSLVLIKWTLECTRHARIAAGTIVGVRSDSTSDDFEDMDDDDHHHHRDDHKQYEEEEQLDLEVRVTKHRE